MSTFIHDGYTRNDGYILADEVRPNGERMFDALEFSYRPATRREVIALDAQIEHACPPGSTDPSQILQGEDLASEFVAKRMVSWSVKAGNIHPVTPSVESMGRLHPVLFAKLYRIVRGSITSDRKPDASEPPKSNEELAKNSERVSC